MTTTHVHGVNGRVKGTLYKGRCQWGCGWREVRNEKETAERARVEKMFKRVTAKFNVASN